MEMDMTQYLDVFLEESKEHLDSLNQCLLKLEKDTGNVAALDEIFRAAHSLKGMSSTMGFDDLADLTHHMENILSDLKKGVLKVSSHVVDILFQCFDRIQIIIDQIETIGSGDMDNRDLIELLENIKTGRNEVIALREEELPVEPVINKTSNQSLAFNQYDITVLKEAVSRNYKIYNIKITVDPTCLMKSVRAFMVFKAIEEDGEIFKSIPPAQDLDEGNFEKDFEIFAITKATSDQLRTRLSSISEISIEQLEEININSINVIPNSREMSNVASGDQYSAGNNSSNHQAPKLKQTVRVDVDRLDKLMNLVGELVMHKGRLEQIGLNHSLNELNETIEQIDRISTDLQSVVMKVRMVPIEQVFNRFPRMVRDLARDLKKDVNFIIEGKETELDRTVIDEIGDPLVHLLRNAIDHGLELPQERVKQGKTPQGTVMLKARHEGNYVYIEVEDDGRGVDTEQVLAKALEKGMITSYAAEQYSREEAMNLLFSPGFSTAENITDVSGRGVGLDVVKTKIEALSGEISITSKLGLGTCFRIKLPLTLAIIQALMVSVRNEIYAIPLSSVDETTMITTKDIKMVQHQEVIMLRGNVLALYRLGDLLNIPGETTAEEMYVVIVRKAERQIGLVVDSLIGQQEIVIKSLGRLLAGIPGIAGAIVAGDGNEGLF